MVDLASTKEMTDATTEATVQIVSTPPLKVADAEIVVCWSRRSTEKNPVEVTQRYRGVVIPRAMLEVPADSVSSKFQKLLQFTIYDLADKKLTEYVKDRMHEITMPLALLSLDSILAFWAEEKQRQSIDAEKITEWLKQSKTLAALPAATQKVWLVKLPKIAAPSYKLQWKQGEAAAVISKLHAEELEHPVAVFIATRCNNVLTEESEEAAL
jgi:hypothetical protein